MDQMNGARDQINGPMNGRVDQMGCADVPCLEELSTWDKTVYLNATASLPLVRAVQVERI